MNAARQPVVVGAVHWDVIGYTAGVARRGDDRPGRIVERPGGVGFNIARALAEAGHAPVLLSAIGRDGAGDALVVLCAEQGLVTDELVRADGATDRYAAIEDTDGLIAAVADTRLLEAAGDSLLAPLRDGRLAAPSAPHDGVLALDGNLSAELLAEAATEPALAPADLRLTAASPEKADRLRSVLGHGRVTLYLNLDEAGRVCAARFAGAAAAADALIARGAQRALVTDGRRTVADADADGALTRTPPAAAHGHMTGAGDAFVAAHIAAELAGAARGPALEAAIAAAARKIAGA